MEEDMLAAPWVVVVVVVVQVQSWAIYLLDVFMKLAVSKNNTWGWVAQFMSDGVQQLLIQRLQL